MKLSENVEIKTNEVKTTNSRASRMARYSAAAAGVAAVSTLDLDAAMIKVIVTDAQNKTEYTLDLSGIYPGSSTTFTQMRESLHIRNLTNTSFANSSNSLVEVFNANDSIFTDGGASGWSSNLVYDLSFIGTKYYGFRVDQGGENKTYGWVRVTRESGNSFTLGSYGYNSTLNIAAVAGQGNVAGVPDSGPGIVGLALIGAGAAGVRLLRKLRVGE